MGGGQSHPQGAGLAQGTVAPQGGLARQHHHHPGGVGMVRQIFGMARERHPGLVNHPLMHGGRNHGGEFPGTATGQGPIQEG